MHKVLTRIYTNELDKELKFYEAVFGQKTKMRSEHKELGLEFAELGNLLFVAGTDEDLRFVRRTLATVVVDSIDEFVPFLESQGARILRGAQPGPLGKTMIVRNPDGISMEYVEYKKDELPL